MANETTNDLNPRLVALGRRIAQAREGAGLSQEQLAIKVTYLSGEELGRGGIAQYERGSAEPPVTRLLDIARATNVTATWLLTGKDLDFFDEMEFNEYERTLATLQFEAIVEGIKKARRGREGGE